MGGFDEALLESVDEALLQLSETVKTIIYQYLKSQRGLDREEIPSRLEDFTTGLRGLLGGGADIILKWAAESLYRRLGLTYEKRPDWNFTDYINHAKKA